jgi:hypothetical protein
MILLSVTGVNPDGKNKYGLFYSINPGKVIKRKRELLKKSGWLMKTLRNY